MCSSLNLFQSLETDLDLWIFTVSGHVVPFSKMDQSSCPHSRAAWALEWFILHCMGIKMDIQKYLNSRQWGSGLTNAAGIEIDFKGGEMSYRVCWRLGWVMKVWPDRSIWFFTALWVASLLSVFESQVADF